VTADVDCELQFVSWDDRFEQASGDHFSQSPECSIL